MMKTILLSLLIINIFTLNNDAQTYDQDIDNLMQEVNLDSLVCTVRELSGEDSVLVNDSLVLISNRESYWGNDIAADYISQRMRSYGYEALAQQYSNKGRNIYSLKTGSVNPEKYVVYCAHYDSETDYCADDNASGVAGVMEAARILSTVDTKFSIIFGFWDEEEVGLRGSYAFARMADTTNMDIVAVLNFEMSGWDGDNDGLIDIHAREVANSVLIANLLTDIDSLYNLPLETKVYTPGASADHRVFSDLGYAAINFSEAYFGGDFNPYYHSNEDRIEHFNLPYYHNISKLGLGSLLSIANENIILDESNNEIANIDTSIWYPLHIGNKWQFSYMVDVSTVFDKTFEVVGDTAIDGKVFSIISENGNKQYHRVENNEVVYEYDLNYDKEYIRYDFKSNDQSVWNLHDSVTYYGIAYTLIDYWSFFEDTLITKTFVDADIYTNISGEQDTSWGSTVDGMARSITKGIGLTEYQLGTTAGGLVGAIINGYMIGRVTNVKQEKVNLSSFMLSQNYPNPFNPSTKISYSIPSQSHVSLKVFDVLGREVATLVNQEKPSGNYSIEFDASNLTSGVYFYRIQAGQYVESKKMVLVK